MAVGNLVDYEDLGNGAFNFVDKTGGRKTFFGPEAADLASRIDATKKLGPQPTAMNDGAGGTTASDLVTPPGGFGGFGGQVPQTVTDAPAPVPGAEGPPASIARPPEAAPAPQPQTLARFAGDKPGQTIMQLPDGSWVEETRTAPSRGGMVEKSRTVKGGFGENEEYKEIMAQNLAAEREGLALGVTAALEDAAAERGYLDERNRQLANQQAEQAAQAETIRKGVAEKQVAYDIAQARFNNHSEIDQDRIWRRKGTGARILGVLGAALGAFGSAMTKTPNFALEMINGEIERDIHAQEQEIAINRESAQNALADLQRQTGSLDLAKSALGAIQTQRMQLQLQNIANRAKTPAAIANFQKALATLSQSYADKLEDYRQKATGEVTKSIVNVPGSAGGTATRYLTLETAQKVKNLYKSDGPRVDPGAVKEERELFLQNERLNTYEDRLKDYNEDDVPLLPENRWVGGRARVAVQDWITGGGSGSSTHTMGRKERELIQDFEQVKTDLTGAIAKGASTGTLSDGDRAAIERGLAPGASVAMLRRAVAAAREVNLRSQRALQQFGPVPAQEIPTRPVE